MRSDTQASIPFFELLNASEGVPDPSRAHLDAALLETGSARPSAATDAMVRLVRAEVEHMAIELGASDIALRLIRFDLTERMEVPKPGRFRLHLVAGEPAEDSRAAGPAVGETAVARLLDGIVGDPAAALLATGDGFDLVCRWAGVGAVRDRAERARATSVNRLSREAMQHPWFEQFARELPDHQHFPVSDDRWTDTILEDAGKAVPIAFEASGVSPLTMLEVARDVEGLMPRFLAMRHHPQLTRHDGDALEKITARYTLLEPLRFHLRRLATAMRALPGTIPEPTFSG